MTIETWADAASIDDLFKDALISWLAKQLVSDQFAKLEQGGHQEGGVPLRKVFVDLPVSEQVQHEPYQSRARPLFLKTLLRQAPREFAPTLDRAALKSETPVAAQARFAHGGFLVIGGPGQGKSTLGQLACQVHRATLLEPFAEHLQANQREVVRSFTSTEARRDIGRARVPLLPLRIVLPEAAAWLSENRPHPSARPVLLDLISSQAAARGSNLPADRLGLLISKAPLLLVLDGLDEVGAAEDRSSLVNAVRSLLGFVSDSGGKGVVVATTRPQGYTGEFERMGVPLKALYLTSLRRQEALGYGEKLAQAKFPVEPEVQTRIVKGLAAAADQPATSRLLSTPLQVTILAALVQRMGPVPSERWGLFERYFATVYDREVERGTYAAPVLRDHRMHVQRIHARVGLLLQVESEQAGGTEARLTSSRLEAIADNVLSEDDIDLETRTALVRRIVRAAEERLVFLVEPEPGKFGFEIRSLQEFMAAWALASDGERFTEARLLQIARASTFRAVALFLASKFFTEGSALRDSLADKICKALNEDADDPVGAAVRAGAVLALEILEEGSATNQPKYVRSLMELLVELLDQPPSTLQVRVARVGLACAEPVLERAVMARLSAPGSWIAIVEAATRGALWANNLGKTIWQDATDPNRLLRTLARSGEPLTPWLANLIESRARDVRPDMIRFWTPAATEFENWPNAFVKLNLAGRRRTTRLGLSWTSVGLEEAQWAVLASIASPSEAWLPWAMAGRFAAEPSAGSLATALDAFAEPVAWEEKSQIAQLAPWPLAACLNSATQASDLVEYAKAARAGRLGDLEDWRAAQREWKKKIGPLFEALPANVPWDLDRLKQAPPLAALDVSGSRNIPLWLSVLDMLSNDNSPLPWRYHFAPAIVSALDFAPTEALAKFSYEQLENWSTYAGEVPLTAFFRRAAVDGDGGEPNGALDTLDRLGRERELEPTYSHASSTSLTELAHAYTRNPERHGLLYWIRVTAMMQGLPPISALEPSSRSALNEVVKDLNPAESAFPDIVILQAWMGFLTDNQTESVVHKLVEDSTEEPRVIWDFTRAVETGALSAEMRESLLLALHSELKAEPGTTVVVLDAMRRLLEERRSGLANRAVWGRLGFTGIPPASSAIARKSFSFPVEPVVLSRIELTAIRGISRLVLELDPPSVGSGQWLIVLGPNGSGKTTLLRGIALTLRNLSDPKIWPKGTFATAWRSTFGGRSSITVETVDQERFVATIGPKGGEAFHREPRDQPTPFPLFGYGCRRGSALGGASREVNTADDDGPEIATLFDEGASLIHAETWLKEWEGASARGDDANSIYSTVTSALRELLGIEQIRIRERQVLVSGPTVGTDVPFAALSDGYLTTAGWFLDLIARWVDLASRLTFPVTRDFLRKMTGLVLLDEIDLHLHPRSQIDVIRRVRSLLPRMSFVVTTHNPLTLVGAAAQEIRVLHPGADETRVERAEETPQLLTGGQLYSRYFGLQSIYSVEIGEALRRYGFLSGDPKRTDEEQSELETLREHLAAQGIDPGWEEVPRLRAALSDSLGSE